MHLKSNTDMIEACKNGNMEVMIAIWKDQLENEFVEKSTNKESWLKRMTTYTNKNSTH